MKWFDFYLDFGVQHDLDMYLWHSNKQWYGFLLKWTIWALRSEARRILGVVTYMPGPSRWSLSQYKVRSGLFRLMSPYQWGSAIHPKVAIWKEEGIEEHSHRVWGTALHTFTQVLQILHAHIKTKQFFFCIWTRMCAKSCQVLLIFTKPWNRL